MNISDLLKAVLVIIVNFAVQWFFKLINVEVDASVLNAIVGGIVTLLLALFLHQAAVTFMPTLVKRGILKE